MHGPQTGVLFNQTQTNNVQFEGHFYKCCMYDLKESYLNKSNHL